MLSDEHAKWLEQEVTISRDRLAYIVSQKIAREHAIMTMVFEDDEKLVAMLETIMTKLCADICAEIFKDCGHSEAEEDG